MFRVSHQRVQSAPCCVWQRKVGFFTMYAAYLEAEAHELLALGGLRQRDVHPLLQPPAQRLVDVPGEVGRRQHHHLPPLRRAVLLAVDAVDLRQ